MKQPDFAKIIISYQLLKDYEGEDSCILVELGYVYGNEEKTVDYKKQSGLYR